MPKNFMTPKVIKYDITDRNTVIELAEGVGIDNQTIIYGVSEFEQNDNTRFNLESTRNPQCGLFYNKKEALKAYALLK